MARLSQEERAERKRARALLDNDKTDAELRAIAAGIGIDPLSCPTRLALVNAIMADYDRWRGLSDG